MTSRYIILFSSKRSVATFYHGYLGSRVSSNGWRGSVLSFEHFVQLAGDPGPPHSCRHPLLASFHALMANVDLF